MKMRAVGLFIAFILVFLQVSGVLGATVAFLRHHCDEFVGKRVELFGSVVTLKGVSVLVDTTDCICIKGLKGGASEYVRLLGVVKLRENTPYVEVVSCTRAIRGDLAVKRATVENKEVFEIVLDEIATAGYTWHVIKIDRSYLRVIDKRSERVTPEGVLGGKNRRVFTFKAIRRGKTVLVLKEYRVWEGAKKSVKSFTLFLDIK